MDKQTPLPPGQRLLDHFPRFGLWQYATRLHSVPNSLNLSLRYGSGEAITLDEKRLADLPRIEQTSDFHCVATWSVCDLEWSGYRFRDFYEQIVLSQVAEDPGIDRVIFSCSDTYQAHMLLDDLLADDVMLADRVNGEVLGFEHGGPLRLVAPAHYGFKSAKHLSTIHFNNSLQGYRTPALHWHEHPRARVAYEERGRFFPSWFWRYIIGRPGLPTVLFWFRRVALKRNQNGSPRGLT